jgi:hypothetical protein
VRLPVGNTFFAAVEHAQNEARFTLWNLKRSWDADVRVRVLGSDQEQPEETGEGPPADAASERETASSGTN